MPNGIGMYLSMAISGLRPGDLDRGCPVLSRCFGLEFLASRDCHLLCVTGLENSRLLFIVDASRNAGNFRWARGAMRHRGSCLFPADVP